MITAALLLVPGLLSSTLIKTAGVDVIRIASEVERDADARHQGGRGGGSRKLKGAQRGETSREVKGQGGGKRRRWMIYGRRFPVQSEVAARKWHPDICSLTIYTQSWRVRGEQLLVCRGSFVSV